MSRELSLSSAWVRRVRASSIATALALASCVVAALALSPPASASLAQSTCHLAVPYQHVVYVQFDNTHLARDNAT